MIARAATLIVGGAVLASMFATGCTDAGPTAADNPKLRVEEDGGGGLVITYTRDGDPSLGTVSATVGGRVANLVSTRDASPGSSGDSGCQVFDGPYCSGDGVDPTTIVEPQPATAIWRSPVVVGDDGALAIDVEESGVHYTLAVPHFGAARSVLFEAPSAPVSPGGELRAKLALADGDGATGAFDVFDEYKLSAGTFDGAASGGELVARLPRPLQWTGYDTGTNGLVDGSVIVRAKVEEQTTCTGDGISCDRFVHTIGGERSPLQIQL